MQAGQLVQAGQPVPHAAPCKLATALLYGWMMVREVVREEREVEVLMEVSSPNRNCGKSDIGWACVLSVVCPAACGPSGLRRLLPLYLLSSCSYPRSSAKPCCCVLPPEWGTPGRKQSPTLRAHKEERRAAWQNLYRGPGPLFYLQCCYFLGLLSFPPSPNSRVPCDNWGLAA